MVCNTDVSLILDTVMLSSRRCTFSTMNNNSSRRPLVVLGGWLGCQPRYLKAYEKLYDHLGFDTLTFIPTPTQVVECTLRPPKECRSMNHLANQVKDSILEHYQQQAIQINSNDNWFYFYHGFSNGGCFLLQHLQPLLAAEQKQHQTHHSPIILPRGIILDSGPAYFTQISHIQFALRYCTIEEREAVGDAFHIMASQQQSSQERPTSKIEQQCQDLFNFLEGRQQQQQDGGSDHEKIPYLFLYSEADMATSSTKIRQLISARQQEKDDEYCWKDSNHCAHYKQHPKEYRQVISNFITQNLGPGEIVLPKSKL